jgi:MFS superfamily sulfate permease-like transporter
VRTVAVVAVIWCAVSIVAGIGFGLVMSMLNRIDVDREVIEEAERILREAVR